MHFNSIATLLGRPVRDINGTPIGQVEDLLIDADNGRIAYVSCQLTDGFGDSRSLTVPWSAVRVARGDRLAVRIVVGEAVLRRLAAANSAIAGDTNTIE